MMLLGRGPLFRASSALLLVGAIMFFLQDIRYGVKALKEEFPPLYKISLDKDAVVFDHLMLTNGCLN